MILVQINGYTLSMILKLSRKDRWVEFRKALTFTLTPSHPLASGSGEEEDVGRIGGEEEDVGIFEKMISCIFVH